MLRLREMRSALEKAKTQGVSMQRRLVLYWFSMALAILAAVLLVVSLTGVFSNTAQKFGQSLTIQKHNTASALAGQMDQLTAQSIALSEELTRELDKQLAAGGRWLDVRLRPYRQHRQVLRQLRPAQARGRELDVHVRRGEQGQILRRVRQTAPGRREEIQMRQVRLGARRSDAPAEVLPAVRRPV